MENIVYRSKGWVSRVLGKMVGWYRKVFRGGLQPQVRPLGSVCEPTRNIWSRVERQHRAGGENRTNTKGERMAIPNDSSSGRASDGFASGGFVSSPRASHEGDIPTTLSDGDDYGAALRYAIAGFDYARGPDRSATTTIYPVPGTGEESPDSLATCSPEVKEDAVDTPKRIKVRRGAVAVKAPEPRKDANKTVHMGNGTLTIDGVPVGEVPGLRIDIRPPRTDFAQSLQRDIAQRLSLSIDSDVQAAASSIQRFGEVAGNAARVISGRTQLVSFAMEYDVRRIANILHIVFLPGTPNAFEYHETVDDLGMERSRNTRGIGITEEIVARFVETSFNIFMENLRTTVMRDVTDQLRSRRQ